MQRGKKEGRQLFEGKSAPPEKILATCMRKGPRLTLIWGPRMVNPALLGKVGVVRRRQLKKVITLQRAITKKIVSFFMKRVTPSVAVPGDIKPSDATFDYYQNRMSMNGVVAVYFVLFYRIR